VQRFLPRQRSLRGHHHHHPRRITLHISYTREETSPTQVSQCARAFSPRRLLFPPADSVAPAVGGENSFQLLDAEEVFFAVEPVCGGGPQDTSGRACARFTPGPPCAKSARFDGREGPACLAASLRLPASPVRRVCGWGVRQAARPPVRVSLP